MPIQGSLLSVNKEVIFKHEIARVLSKNGKMVTTEKMPEFQDDLSTSRREVTDRSGSGIDCRVVANVERSMSSSS